MIENDTELVGTQTYICKLQQGLAAMRKTLPDAEYAQLSAQFLREIDKKQEEIRAYLSHSEPLKAAA